MFVSRKKYNEVKEEIKIYKSYYRRYNKLLDDYDRVLNKLDDSQNERQLLIVVKNTLEENLIIKEQELKAEKQRVKDLYIELQLLRNK